MYVCVCQCVWLCICVCVCRKLASERVGALMSSARPFLFVSMTLFCSWACFFFSFLCAVFCIHNACDYRYDARYIHSHWGHHRSKCKIFCAQKCACFNNNNVHQRIPPLNETGMITFFINIIRIHQHNVHCMYSCMAFGYNMSPMLAHKSYHRQCLIFGLFAVFK